jgi:hypothetical protein
MSKTFTRFAPAAVMAQQYANLLREVRRLGRELSEYHLQNDFADAGGPGRGYVQTDDDGQIRGVGFTPAQYLATVALAAQVEKLLTGEVPTPGNYVSTLEQVVKL